METKQDTAVKISTPCIRKCKLINDHCVGCGRSWEQLRDWSFYTENQRLEIMKDLKPNKELDQNYERREGR
jgi:predicted Fe-S protein YdhL (DUF1289 family)